jgi:hypothetical protein
MIQEIFFVLSTEVLVKYNMHCGVRFSRGGQRKDCSLLGCNAV